MSKTYKTKTKPSHGGARERAGRPPKEDPENWVTISCVLRKDTVEILRDHGRRRLFGPFLQWVLDRHPLPSDAEYRAALLNKPLMGIELPARRRIPVVISAGTRQKKKRKLSPETEKFLAAYDALNDGNKS